MAQLREDFKNGRYWNHPVEIRGTDGNSLQNNKNNAYADFCSDYPCSYHDRSTTNMTDIYDCNYYNGLQCFGFARRLAFLYYGSDVSGWTSTTDSGLDSLKPGDVVDYGWYYDSDGGIVWGHTVWITVVNGNAINYTDCNGESLGNPSKNCQIRWDKYAQDKNSMFDETALGKHYTIRHAPYAAVDTPAHYAEHQDLGDDFYAYIYNSMSGCNLENRNDNVQLASVNASDFRQIWHFIKQDQGQYKIVNMFDGRCLDAENLGTTNGTNIHMCEDNGSEAQRWWFCADYNYGPYYVYPFYLTNHDLVLDVAGAGTTPGTNIQLIQNSYKETGVFHPAQTFQVNKIDNIGKISIGNDFYAYMNHPFSGLNVGNVDRNVELVAVEQYDPKQIWHFIWDDTRSAYKITNAYDDRCLEAYDEVDDSGNVRVNTDNGAITERWWACGFKGEERYYFTPVYLGDHHLAMDVAWGNVAPVPPGRNIGFSKNWYLDHSIGAGGKLHDAQTFEIQHISYTKPAAPSVPTNIQVSATSSGTTITWDEVPTVGRYDSRDYSIYLANTKNEIFVPTTRVNDNRYVSDVVLPDGEYFVTVQACNTKYYRLISDVGVYEFSVAPESVTHTITVNATEGGTASGGGIYSDGTSITVTAAASEGYEFKGWTENGSIVSGDAEYTFTVDADRTLTATFEKEPAPVPVTHTVSVSADPAEGGTVSGSGTYQDNESVTVTATANIGYTFKIWTEGGSAVSTSAAYTFTATADRTLAAVFEKEPDNPDPPTPVTTYTVSVNASPTAGGTVSGGGSYQENTSVTVRATANSGYTFKGWIKSGTQVSTDVNYTFSVTENTSLTAVFEADVPTPIPTYRVSVSAMTGGTVTGGGTYQSGASVTVTATPSNNYRFVEWREDGKPVSADATYTFSVSADRSLTAVFEQIEQPPTPSYIVSASADPVEGGSVSGGGSFQLGTSVTITATADNGYRFVCWMNGDERASLSPSYTFSVSGNASLVAVFEENPPVPPTSYTISVQASPAEGGTVRGGGTYRHGASVTVTATPNDGYRFVEWRLNGTQVSTTAVYSFATSADQMYTAIFEKEEGPPTPPTPVSYTISVGASPVVGGSATGGGSYQENTSATVTATANEGYTFKRWTEDGSEVSTDISHTFTVAKDRTLVAVFEKKEEEKPPTPTSYTISLSANPSAGGTVSGGGAFAENSTATITATANSNYRFTGWFENGSQVSTDASYTFTVSADRTLVAGFTYTGGGSTAIPDGNPGGNPSSGNTGNTSPSQPSLPVSTSGANSSMTTTASPSASIRGDIATSVITSVIAKEIIKQATTNNSGEVIIAPVVGTDVTKVEITLPATVLSEIEQKTNAGLVISTPHAYVSFQNSGLSTFSGKQDVVVSTERTGNALELSITAGGQPVERVPGGLTLTASVEHSAPGTVAVMVHEDGSREVIRKSVAGGGTITIPLDGPIKVVIMDNAKSFADVNAGSWAMDAVAFVSAHELFSGTSADRFSPDLPMTRGMLAQVLHNLENNPGRPFAGTFSDVSTDAWYSEAVAWAAERGIVSGHGNGLFGPGDNITREQLAVMLWRYAGEPAATNKELHFHDADEVSGYALDALRWAVENGIINGKGGGILDPQGQATRAQVAQMLMNYLKK